MADRPIIFSAPMVLALLAGTKTQTRRLLKLRWPLERTTAVCAHPAPGDDGRWFVAIGLDTGQETWIPLAYAPGDRLWVREAWSGNYAFRHTPPAQRQSVAAPDGPILREDVWYWADGNPDGGDYERGRPGIHMPRWASRLTLTVTDVRVQRLQEISEADARAEGVMTWGQWLYDNVSTAEIEHMLADCGEPAGSLRCAFACLWNSINGPGAWDANPWVAAISFVVEHRNIDEAPR